MDSYQDKYYRLVGAVVELYNAAYWTSDRLGTEQEDRLWRSVRDAAGLKKAAPEGDPYSVIFAEYAKAVEEAMCELIGVPSKAGEEDNSNYANIEKTEKPRKVWVKETTRSGWCTPEYMAYKTGLPLVTCKLFLSGPDHSLAHGLPLTESEAAAINALDLSKDAEMKEMAEFSKDPIGKLLATVLEGLNDLPHGGKNGNGSAG